MQLRLKSEHWDFEEVENNNCIIYINWKSYYLSIRCHHGKTECSLQAKPPSQPLHRASPYPKIRQQGHGTFLLRYKAMI